MEILLSLLMIGGGIWFGFKKYKAATPAIHERVKVVHNRPDVEFNVPYRLYSDDPNVIRYRPSAPREGYVSIYDFLPVTGISYDGRDKAAKRMIFKGQNRGVRLQRDLGNKFDPNAIKVIGHWMESGRQKEAQIGFIPADTAEELKHFSGDMVATISQIFAPSRDKTPGFRIDI